MSQLVVSIDCFIDCPLIEIKLLPNTFYQFFAFICNWKKNGTTMRVFQREVILKSPEIPDGDI